MLSRMNSNKCGSRQWSALAFVVFAFVGSAFAAPPAALTEKAKIKIDVHSKLLTVKVTPPEGTKLNYEGPWKLELKGPTWFNGANSLTAGLSAFKKETEQFEIAVSSSSPKKEELDFTLTYFYCAKDSSWCKRAVENGKVSVAATN